MPLPPFLSPPQNEVLIFPRYDQIMAPDDTAALVVAHATRHAALGKQYKSKYSNFTHGNVTFLSRRRFTGNQLFQRALWTVESEVA
jgi:hypothetical protein